MPPITLTPDQQDAKDKFLQFLLSKEKEFYLFGPAGSGKSFLIKHLGELVQSVEYENIRKMLGLKAEIWNVTYTATTNKAAAILSEFLRIEVHTIYHYFGIKVEEDFKKGTTNLTRDFCAKDVKNETVCFIDECSLLSQKALKMIRDLTRFVNVKLVFIGDNNQLAPVNEKPYWNNTPSFNTAFLSTPVRNKEHKALIELCDQLKYTVQSGEFFDINLVPGVIDYIEDEDALDLVKTFEPYKDIILSYTNSRVDKCLAALKEAKPELANETCYINANHSVPYYIRGSSKQLDAFYPEEKVRLIDLITKSRPIPGIKDLDGSLIYADFYRVRSSAFEDFNCFILSGSDYAKYCNMFAKAKQWIDYFHIKNGTMVLRLPYASTIHKAQGSTYNRVFIDLDSFRYCKDRETLARLLYVAVSRAKNHVYLSGSLPKGCGRIV